MTRIWVLGAGQLGAMLQHAGQPLAFDVRPIDIADQHLPELHSTDLITAEREQWPDTPVTRLLASHPHFINRRAFTMLADRLTQKQLLDELQLATAPWRAFDADTELTQLHQALGEKVLLKRRCGGYDGRGQHWLNAHHADTIDIQDWRNHAIAEQRIEFTEEISLIGARNASGQEIYYPLTLNLQVEGILMASIAPLARLTPLQPIAQQMLSRLMHHLGYVGVMAMECFRVGEHLLINEVAPRVHNSGHWTQAGASPNQFEAHLRAIADLPLCHPQSKCLTVMINLIGVAHNPQWLSVPGAELYWYNKSVRPGRKVGHINLTADNIPQLKQRLTQLQNQLPDQYAKVISWTHQQLE
jgi:5-(carboxyamino)imidazole ribonucleotide synthase